MLERFKVSGNVGLANMKPLKRISVEVSDDETPKLILSSSFQLDKQLQKFLVQSSDYGFLVVAVHIVPCLSGFSFVCDAFRE